MNTSTRLIHSAFTSMIAIGVASAANQALTANKFDQEKYADIVKAGKSDCDTSVTSCAGTGVARHIQSASICVFNTVVIEFRSFRERSFNPD